jgi:hypothetical protein
MADLRDYYFQRDYKGGSTDKESFTVGGILRGGVHLHHDLSAGLSLYTFQVTGLNDHEIDVYNLLLEDAVEDHENYTAIGGAYIEIHDVDFSFKLRLQEIFAPWLNRYDFRLPPQSFDAVSLVWALSDSIYVHVCHSAEAKFKKDTHIRSMCEAAGFGSDEAVSCYGFEEVGVVGLKHLTCRVHELWGDPYLLEDYRPERCYWHAVGGYLNRNTSDAQLADYHDSWCIGMAAGITLDDFEFSAVYFHFGDRKFLHKWGHETTISTQFVASARMKGEAWLVSLRYTRGGYSVFFWLTTQHRTAVNTCCQTTRSLP